MALNVNEHYNLRFSSQNESFKSFIKTLNKEREFLSLRILYFLIGFLSIFYFASDDM